MTLPDLTHVEVQKQKAVRTPKKTCPKCKTQVPVARQRCENCPHQFISNAAPDREARKVARKEKKRLRAHRDGIQAAAKRLRAAAEEGAANARETIDFAPDLATHGFSLGWRGAHVAVPTEGMMLAREALDAAPAEPIFFEPAVWAAVPEAPASAPEAPMPMDVAPDVPVALPDAPAAAPEAPMQIDVAPEAPAPALYPPAPALEVAAARERAKYEEMQRSLRQEVAMWKTRSQRFSRGSCVVINEGPLKESLRVGASIFTNSNFKLKLLNVLPSFSAILARARKRKAAEGRLGTLTSTHTAYFRCAAAEGRQNRREIKTGQYCERR